MAHFSNALKDAKTIIWNGPMGVLEEPPFDEGTVGIARAVAEAADHGATVVVGGGDSVAAVTKAGVADRITHISTGGGATLEFLSGDELPGLAALKFRLRWQAKRDTALDSTENIRSAVTASPARARRAKGD